jgi:hypothetical protein
MPAVLLRDSGEHYNNRQYKVVSPEGYQVEIPRELFGALSDFLHGHQSSGSVVIQFRNGGVAGLEALVKKTYK